MRWRELGDELGARVGTTEAGFVLHAVSGRDRGALLRCGGDTVAPDVVERAREIAGRVEQGEPLQHVLGSWGFRTVDLLVDRRALIPRPETEVLVDHVLCALERRRGVGPPLVVDLGTGSGAIACALVAERDDVVVIAVDSSPDALALAATNRSRLGDPGARMRLVGSDWYGAFGPALRGRVAVIVANPPYLSEAEWREAPPVVREWDPYDALVGGEVGTEAIEAVGRGAADLLEATGTLVLEIGSGQAVAVAAILGCLGATRVEISTDLVGRDRVATASW